MTIENGPTIRSKSTSSDMYSSITDCASQAKRKLRKFKDRFRRGHHKDVPEFSFEGGEEEEEEYAEETKTTEVTKIKV
ncbi:hypothetical protein TL16_g03197 [Triparma laevis f. inornata]|uniref:Uncharacterized protein n=1 Tax=Triparma laevis f. inornata TaxID=1714386 RepID=A0A9W7DZU3_9STRA|nr:hypothetical protein TL16_g03197 [Triparma laevis f. inornata]